MIYFCSQQNRRALVLQHPALNGIDYLEVCDDDGDGGCGKRLLITLLKDARPVALAPAQVRITGGSPAAQVAARSPAPANATAPRPGIVHIPNVHAIGAGRLELRVGLRNRGLSRRR